MTYRHEGFNKLKMHLFDLHDDELLMQSFINILVT